MCETKLPLASDNLAVDISRIKELEKIKSIRVLRSTKTKGVTIVFVCEPEPGKMKELPFTPWNVIYKSKHFYLDDPVLCFFDQKNNCHEDTVAFTLACMKALNEKGVDYEYINLMFSKPAEIANELLKAYPSTEVQC